MKTIKILLFISLISCSKNAPPQDQESLQNEYSSESKQSLFNENDAPCEVQCEKFDTKICEDLTREEAQCQKTKNKSGCSKFIQVFEKSLAQKIKCEKKCSKDTKRWLTWEQSLTHQCDKLEAHNPERAKITERSGYLIVQLKWKEALQVVASDHFTNIIDGAMGDLKIPHAEARKKHSK